MGDTSVLVWDLSRWRRRESRPSVKLDARRLRLLWDDLADRNAARAYRAQQTLHASPEQAVALLRRRLRPAPDGGFARLIADLDADEFAVREKAFQALARRGLEVEPALRSLRARPPSPEVRTQVQRLLARLGKERPSAEMLRHGVFFHFVLQGLGGKAKNEDGEVTWNRLADYVTRQVSRQTPTLVGGGARQTPHEVRDLRGESPVLLALAASRPERAEGRVERPRVRGKESEVERPGRALGKISNSIGMKLVLIPAGTFTMGSPAAEKDRSTEEEQHEVEITKAFYLGVTEVTQKQYRAVMSRNPSYFSATGEGKAKVAGMNTDDFPVEQVSWHDAVEFCNKLSAWPAERRAGREYRLPTEAEWEYACRAAAPARHPFHYGPSLSSTQANIDGSYSFDGAAKGPYLGRTCAVGSYKPNKFSLHDMHGNVKEWCSDWYVKDYHKSSPRKDPTGPSTGTARVLRGGAWCYLGNSCRAAIRLRLDPGSRLNFLGFRVAVSLPRRAP
jgi:formylglycine-generating enzyme required for sulfatase activity